MAYARNKDYKELKKNGGLDIGSVQEPDTDYDNFHSGVMNTRDIIQNIIRNLSDVNVSGVTFKFQDDKLILTVNCYEYPNDEVLKDLIGTSNEAIKYLKKKFKDVAGKNLKMKKLGDAYDVVGAYTTNQKAKISYTLTFDIGTNKDDAKVNSLDKENVYDDNRKPDFKLA